VIDKPTHFRGNGDDSTILFKQRQQLLGELYGSDDICLECAFGHFDRGHINSEVRAHGCIVDEAIEEQRLFLDPSRELSDASILYELLL
jgi:hypothetical protein